MGGIHVAFLISLSIGLKDGLLGFHVWRSSKTATFLQSARCPFVKQTNLAALCSELAAVKLKRGLFEEMKGKQDGKRKFKQNPHSGCALYRRRVCRIGEKVQGNHVQADERIPEELPLEQAGNSKEQGRLAR